MAEKGLIQQIDELMARMSDTSHQLEQLEKQAQGLNRDVQPVKSAAFTASLPLHLISMLKRKVLLRLVLILALLIPFLTYQNSSWFVAPSPAKADSNIVGDGNWVWQNPKPTGNSLKAVVCSAKGDCIAVGDTGIIYKYANGIWSFAFASPGYQLSGLACTSTTNCFAVGWSGLIEKYDGTGWTILSSVTC